MIEVIKLTFTKNNVNVFILIEKLYTISAVIDKKVSIFDEEMFKNIKSIDSLFEKLRSLWSIFDYELLQYIVEISECKEAQDVLIDFLEKLDPSAIKDVDLVLHFKENSWKRSLMPVLRVKVKAEKYTVDIQKSTEKVLSKVFNLSKLALHFQCVKNTCELVYYISEPLKLYLLQLEIAEGCMVEFSAHCINSIHIDEFKLKVPSKIINLKVSRNTYVHTISNMVAVCKLILRPLKYATD